MNTLDTVEDTLHSTKVRQYEHPSILSALRPLEHLIGAYLNVFLVGVVIFVVSVSSAIV